MEISLEDFNSLSAERSRREVQIARLQMELEAMRRAHENEVSAIRMERDALQVENEKLMKENELLKTDYENVRFENHWMKQYILLSVERVKTFFARIRNVEMLSAVKSFVMGVLPENASAEQIAYASQMMQLPLDNPETKLVQVAGNYNDIHDNGTVNRV